MIAAEDRIRQEEEMARFAEEARFAREDRIRQEEEAAGRYPAEGEIARMAEE